jgi:signal peptidase I
MAGVWLVLAAGVFVFRAVLYEPYRAPSGSMMPALLPGDFFLVNKLPYGNYGTFGIDFSPAAAWAADPEPGDVVVFRFPPNPSVRYVKRLIGLPGDTIEVRGSEVLVNGAGVTRAAAPRPEALAELHTID